MHKNAHKPGYKQTPLGWVPEEWEVKKLEEVAQIQQGVSKGKSIREEDAIDMPYLRVANVKDGYFDLNEVKQITVHKVEYNRYLLNQEDILITEGGDPDKLGRGSIWQNEVENCIFQNHLFRIRATKSNLNPYYLYNYLQGKKSKDYFLSSAKQTTGIASVNSSQVKAMPILLPPLPEQNKIATILSTWDTAIAKTQEIIRQLQVRNRGLMQELLAGKRRLKESYPNWREVRLGEIFRERNETNTQGTLLSITADRGVIYQSESDKKDTSNEDKSKYRRICVGDIGYNTMRMWQGRSALSNLEGIVSPAYTIVKANEDQYSPFYALLFKLPAVINKFYRNSQGLVDDTLIDDTLNCKFKDFALVSVTIPDYEEQVKITEVISKAIEEQKHFEDLLSTLQTQKKGLMQKLLTGAIRVNLNQETS